MKKGHIIFYAVLIICVGLLIYFLFKTCNNPKPDIKVTGTDSTVYWKNKYGESIASQKAKEEDFAKAKEGMLDSLADHYNTKVKFIREALIIAQRGKETLTPHDTVIIEYEKPQGDCPPQIRTLRQAFESPYYLSEVTINAAFPDSSTNDIQSVDTLTVLWKEVREGNIFNRRHYLQLDIKNANPNNLITGIEAYRKALPKPKRFGIGVQGGYGFSSGLTPKPYMGVGVSYNLIRL